MSEFVFVNRLQAKDGQREQLIELLREFAVSMHAEPGCIHYSIHQPADDETGPLTVIQAYSSIEAFQEHSAWMGPNVPRLAALLESLPQPPVLLQQVPLSGHAKESLAAAR
ncbi:MAG: putative quinol monooxygenase [Actinocrinis sp.]